MKLHVAIALATDADEEFLRPGAIQLLESIERTGSIQQAARALSVSYVKALDVLNRMERGLGQSLLIRRKGGAARGGATLTLHALGLMREFAVLRRKVDRSAAAAFGVFAGKCGAAAEGAGRRRAGSVP